jgi:hypothetical protein
VSAPRGASAVDEVTYSNAIGDAVLGAYWQDPESDPAQRAFCN